MTRGSTVFQLRSDNDLKQAFVTAAERESITPSRAMGALIESFVRESWFEVERQSRLVAEASSRKGIMDEIERAQAWIHGCAARAKPTTPERRARLQKGLRERGGKGRLKLDFSGRNRPYP